MKTTRIVALLAAVMFVSVYQASAQKVLKKAEKQFQLKAYDLAVSSFTRALEEDPECTRCIFMIAESYRMMNKNIDATLWFRKLDGRKNIPDEYKLSYGLTMKRMGLYDKAQDLFFAYKAIDPVIGEHYALSCDFAKSALTQNENYEVALYKTCSRASDFAPTFWKNKLIYSSFRTDLKREETVLNKSYIQNQGSQLFVSAKGLDIDRNAVEFLRSDLEEDYTISCASVSDDDQKIAYIKGNFVNGCKHIVTEEMDISLFTASIDANGKISNEKAFKYNEIGYATAFPSLNANGTIMYFASNRPGGYGGYDLYVSYNKNGEWTYPENLGDKINSPGNEVTPFFDGEKIYFSSDYHHGFGGFDVFESYVNNGEWTFPENMGNGINSPEDDLYLVEDSKSGLYYYTSNRLGGRGNHDIYAAIPVINHDFIASDDFDFDEGALVPRAVSLDDLAIQTEEPSNDLVQSVSEIEEVTVVNDNQPIAVKKEGKLEVTLSNGSSDNKPPKAVNLDELKTDETSGNEVANTAVVKENVAVSKVNLVGAKRVAFGEVIKSSSDVYFIQLAALYKNNADMTSFSPLRSYGSLYKVYENSATKVRLGYYLDEYEAKGILNQVKMAGYTDAFITLRPLNTSNMELALSSDSSGSTNYYGTGSSQYKIRLASYADPIYFDVNRVKDIGVIEQWSKKNWTIFVLSGYASLEEAEAARIKALNRGFSDAEVVVDNNGVLEKLIRN